MMLMWSVTTDVHSLLGDSPLDPYWLLYGLAWFAGGLYVAWEARRVAVSLIPVVDAVLLSVPFSLVASHLLCAVLYGPAPDLLTFFLTWRGWCSGYVSFGGVAGVLVALYVAAKLHDLSFLLLADCAGPALFLCSFIGRVGCFVHGCCYGATTSLPWAVTFTPHALSGSATPPSHPTQLYEAALSLVAFVVVVRARRKVRRWGGNGATAVSCLLCYLTIRLLVEFARMGGTAEPMAFGLSSAQLISLTGIALCGTFLARQARLRSDQGAPATNLNVGNSLVVQNRRARSGD